MPPANPRTLGAPQGRFSDGRATVKTRSIEKTFGKKNFRKNPFFSGKTCIRARGAYENPRKQPAYVLEKVADARKTP
jgi:hypothetical protein